MMAHKAGLRLVLAELRCTSRERLAVVADRGPAAVDLLNDSLRLNLDRVGPGAEGVEVRLGASHARAIERV
ncbi:MAG: hypothetical protein ACRYG8_21690 [Janthinobacterium lividum]